MTKIRRVDLSESKKQFLSGIGFPDKSRFEIDDFQADAINAIAAGDDVLVVAPTGSGKTYIALETISLALNEGKSAIYTTPLKALSNTKFIELSKKFEPRFKVGLLTGDRKIDGDSKVVVATTEIYRNELYRGMDRYNVVVLDEVHYIADAQRGPVWEESIILTPKASRLLMLSASISNPKEIAGWVEEIRDKPCRIVIKSQRPVELRYGFIHPELGIMPLADTDGRVNPDVTEFYQGATLDPQGMRLSRNSTRTRISKFRKSNKR